MRHTQPSCLIKSHPDQSHIAYLALIIAEARCNGGDGWLTYHSIFLQNAAEDTFIAWERLDPSLHTATFAAQSTGPGSICLYCSACDHSAGDCALRPFVKAGGVKGNPPMLQPSSTTVREGEGSCMLKGHSRSISHLHQMEQGGMHLHELQIPPCMCHLPRLA